MRRRRKPKPGRGVTKEPRANNLNKVRKDISRNLERKKTKPEIPSAKTLYSYSINDRRFVEFMEKMLCFMAPVKECTLRCYKRMTHLEFRLAYGDKKQLAEIWRKAFRPDKRVFRCTKAEMTRFLTERSNLGTEHVISRMLRENNGNAG